MMSKRIIALFVSLLLMIVALPDIFGEEISSKWMVSSTRVAALNLNPLQTNCFFYNNQLHAASIINGQIVLCELEGSQWVERQRLAPRDSLFTTMQIKDLTGNLKPEIIAGTEAPGFIYIYSLNERNEWVLNNFGKYLWSPIANIIAGNFTGSGINDFIVQDAEGFVFYLKKTGESLDLLWKSPAVWRQISSFIVMDFDDDGQDELVATYKTGGVAVLEIQNNALIPVWENYPWGRVLAMTQGDWNNDGTLEFIMTTSQRILYTLSYSEQKYHFIQNSSQFDYLVENLKFIPTSTGADLLATDTSGYLHILQYNPSTGKWVEQQNFQIGRIAKIISEPARSQFAVWDSSRRFVFFNQDNQWTQVPLLDGFFQEIGKITILTKEGRVFINPEHLSQLDEVNLTMTNLETTIQLTANNTVLIMDKKYPYRTTVNGEPLTVPDGVIFLNNHIYISLEVYRELFDVMIHYREDGVTVSDWWR